MSPQAKGPLALSLLIMAIGVGWLLSALNVFPQINWVWILGLGVVGVLVFVISGGVDKVSVVIGPFFIIASLLSILRQSGRMTLDVEVPMLVIAIGALLFVAQLRVVPLPKWYELIPPERKDAQG
jgi:hypothetical protein